MTRVMDIYVVRHGESVGNTKRGFISGRRDPDGLTDRGRAQITRTAWELRDASFDVVFASPVARAQETGAILSQLLDVPIETIEDFTELDHGVFEMHYWWEKKDAVPKAWREGRKEDFDTPYPEGESFGMLCERIQNGMKKLVAMQNKYKRVLVVSHMAPIITFDYFAQHGLGGNFSRSTVQQQYLSYVHSEWTKNGGILKYKVVENELQKTGSVQEFENVAEREESVGFYARGVLGEKSSRVKTLKSTSENSVYLAQNDETYIVKLLQNGDGQRLTSLYSYLCKQDTIPSPCVAHLDTSRVFFDREVLIQDYIAGVELADCVSCKTNELGKVNKHLFEILSAIHEQDIDTVKEFWLCDGSKSWKDYILGEMKKTEKSFSDFGLSSKVLSKVKDDFECLRTYISDEKGFSAPIHGDFSPHNIVVDDVDGCDVVRILDFERVRVGDPLWDYVYYYGWIARLDKDKAEQFREVVWDGFDDRKKKVFYCYLTLFHAWSVRDMLDYQEHEARNDAGEKSLEILKRV